jgi:hypothetical protein
MAEVTDFLDQVLDQDYASAAPTFKDIMGDIMINSLEQEKVKVAGQVFNGVDAEERADNDQYELELDDANEDDIDEDDDLDLDNGAEEAMELEDYDEDVE